MRPARLEIDPSAIADNLRAVAGIVGPQVRLIAVVKADAYGHGALAASHACLAAGADMLAVALVEEALALRQAGILAPVMVLGALLPQQAGDLVAADLTAAVMDLDFARALAAAAQEAGKCARVHLKVDTGMSRAGVRVDALGALVPQLARLSNLHWEGIMSHLADPAGNPAYTAQQLAAFRQAIATAESVLGPLPYQHLASSPALCVLPECRFTAVRPGNMLYGALEGIHAEFCPVLRPAMALKAPVALLKPVRCGEGVSYGCTYRPGADTIVALVPVGYADGYPRALSGRAEVLIGGQRYPVVGRVCMDAVLVDVGPEPICHVGDEVVLLGAQGEEEITLHELAERAGTITQEIMARMGSRLPRVYLHEGETP